MDVSDQLLLVLVQDLDVAVQLFELLADLFVGVIVVIEVFEFAVQRNKALAKLRLLPLLLKPVGICLSLFLFVNYA